MYYAVALPLQAAQGAAELFDRLLESAYAPSGALMLVISALRHSLVSILSYFVVVLALAWLVAALKRSLSSALSARL